MYEGGGPVYVISASDASSKGVSWKGPRIVSVINRNFDAGFTPGRFYSAVLDDNNGKWFLTDAGIVRGDLFSITDRMQFTEVSGRLSELTGTENSLFSQDHGNIVYELSDRGPGIWMATPAGAISALLPAESGITEAAIYNTSNSGILDNKIYCVAAGRNQLRWFGTSKGISALSDKKWLTPDYREIYPENLLKYYPIRAMTTSQNGDSLYVATEGAGVMRVFRNQVDAISGASQYQKWGPIKMPSDTVCSLLIARDGTQWIGTDKGVARHTGFNTLENWTVFNTSNGLINNYVRAIAAEPYGNNIWFGTKGGVSVFDGASIHSYTMKNGLISDNILFIMADKNGLVYLGTDNGLMIYSDGHLVCYRCR